MKLLDSHRKNFIDRSFPKNFLQKVSEFLDADDRSEEIEGLKGCTFASFDISLSKEPFPLYEELKQFPHLTKSYKKEEEKHLDLYDFLYDPDNTYFFDYHYGYYFLFKIESMEEYIELCLLNIKGERQTSFLYGDKLLVAEGIDTLRINLFYPNMKKYEPVKTFALNRGFIVFDD